MFVDSSKFFLIIWTKRCRQKYTGEQVWHYWIQATFFSLLLTLKRSQCGQQRKCALVEPSNALHGTQIYAAINYSPVNR
jgi:hypothetical protein